MTIAAVRAVTARVAEPWNSHSLTDRQLLDAVADRQDAPDDLMPRNYR
jgi:hypothetical protein